VLVNKSSKLNWLIRLLVRLAGSQTLFAVNHGELGSRLD